MRVLLTGRTSCIPARAQTRTQRTATSRPHKCAPVQVLADLTGQTSCIPARVGTRVISQGATSRPQKCAPVHGLAYLTRLTICIIVSVRIRGTMATAISSATKCAGKSRPLTQVGIEEEQAMKTDVNCSLALVLI